MAFRQNNKRSDDWRRTFRPQVIAAGLPDFVVDNWNYVLLHGYDHESGWNPWWITSEQANVLLRLIRSRYDSTGHWLFQELEKRIKDNEDTRTG